MAVYTFGLTATTDLLTHLPYDPSQIGAATTPIKQADLTDALIAGSAKMFTLGASLGIVVDAALATSDEEAHDVMMRAAIAYAVADVLSRDGKYAVVRTAALERFADLYNQVAAMPSQSLGDAYPSTSGIDVDIDTVGDADDTELGGDWDWETDGSAF